MSLRPALTLQHPPLPLVSKFYGYNYAPLCLTREMVDLWRQIVLFFQIQLLYVPDNFSWTSSPPRPACIEYICTLHLWAHGGLSVEDQGRSLSILLTEEGGRNQIQSSLPWPVFLMCTGDLPACMSKRCIHAAPMETRRGGSPGPGVSVVSCH